MTSAVTRPADQTVLSLAHSSRALSHPHLVSDGSSTHTTHLLNAYYTTDQATYKSTSTPMAKSHTLVSNDFILSIFSEGPM